MIPLHPQKDFTPRRREYWIPSTVSFQEEEQQQDEEVPMLTSVDEKHQVGGEEETRTLEEICAANVLISLSPPKPSFTPSSTKVSAFRSYLPLKEQQRLVTPVSPQVSSTYSLSPYNENTMAAPSRRNSIGSGGVSHWHRYAPAICSSSSTDYEYESSGSLSGIEQTSSGYNSDTTAPTHDGGVVYYDHRNQVSSPAAASSVAPSWFPGTISLSFRTVVAPIRVVHRYPGQFDWHCFECDRHPRCIDLAHFPN